MVWKAPHQLAPVHLTNLISHHLVLCSFITLQPGDVQQKCNGSHQYNFKFSSSHTFSKLKKSKINLSIFYLTKHTMVSIWNHYKILKILHILFVVLSPSSKLVCILHLQTTSIPESCMWLVARSFFIGQYSSSYTDFSGSQNTNSVLRSLGVCVSGSLFWESSFWLSYGWLLCLLPQTQLKYHLLRYLFPNDFRQTVSPFIP